MSNNSGILSNLETNNNSNTSIADTLTPGDYVQIDVNGDGNCFYRALYYALKHHTIPNLLTRFFTCIFAGDEADKPADPEDISEDEFWFLVRSKLGKEILKEDGIMEEQARAGLAPGGVPETLFDMLKESAADEMAMRATDEYKAFITRKKDAMDKVKKEVDTIKALNTLFDDIEKELKKEKDKDQIKEYKKLLKETTSDLSTTNKKMRAARTSLQKIDRELEVYIENTSARWYGHINNMPSQIRSDPLLGSAESYATMTKAQFKEAIVRYLTNDVDGSWMYASDFDTYLMRFMMSRCENPIVIDLIPVHDKKYRIREINASGIPQVHLVLIQDIMEHYNYVVRADKYKENLRGERIIEVIDQQRFRAFYKNTARNAAARGLRPSATRKAAAIAVATHKGPATRGRTNATRKATATTAKAAATTAKAASTSPRTKAAIAAAIAEYNATLNDKSKGSSTKPAAATPKSAIERLREKRAAAAAATTAEAPAVAAEAPATTAEAPAVAAEAPAPAKSAIERLREIHEAKKSALMAAKPPRRSTRSTKKTNNSL